jgi:hypothetical protein
MPYWDYAIKPFQTRKPRIECFSALRCFANKGETLLNANVQRASFALRLSTRKGLSGEACLGSPVGNDTIATVHFA